jgi:hypothetical protein
MQFLTGSSYVIMLHFYSIFCHQNLRRKEKLAQGGILVNETKKINQSNKLFGFGGVTNTS